MAAKGPSKVKRKSLDLSEQYKLCQEIDNNPSINRGELAKRFGISNSGLTGIYARKTTIYHHFRSGNFKNSSKRMRTIDLHAVDDELLNWFRSASAENMEGLGGLVLVEKAVDFALLCLLSCINTSSHILGHFRC